jgi:aromatic-L-amino-acid/L-tryptophan decarboxylase
MANMISVLVARRAALGPDVRRLGVAAGCKRLVGYASAGAHASVIDALDIAGLGSEAMRLVPVDARHRMDIDALARTIAADREAGFTPFFVAGTAGTVDTGAVDDLDALADIAQKEKLWFHVDGALGALGMLAPDIAPQLHGIERADSIAFDFHKWGQVPYDAGFILVRDAELHRDTFASPAAYLRREGRGMAAGSPWPCDFGPDLSRGFRALKTWFTLKTYGTERLGAVISRTCAVARYLEQRVRAEPRLELLAPAQMNIVCFRYRCADADAVNNRIVVALHERGVAAPSTTTVGGVLAIRAAIVNHRTQPRDIDVLIEATLAFGAAEAAR